MGTESVIKSAVANVSTARRDNVTSHHTSVQGSLNTIDIYLSLGMSPSKMNLGFAFYAKWFKTQGTCTQPIGCPTVLLEAADGSDTGMSGAVTFRDVPPILSSGIADTTLGGEWYWDPSTSYFWTWDTPQFIAEKFTQIVQAKGLGGVSKFPTLQMISYRACAGSVRCSF